MMPFITYVYAADDTLKAIRDILDTPDYAASRAPAADTPSDAEGH